MELPLQGTVVLGYVDTSALSCRAVLGMKLDGADIVTVDRPTAATCLEVACRRNVADVGLETGREEFPPCDRPFQVWNVPEKQVSVCIINAYIPPEKTTTMANDFVSLLQSNCVQWLIVPVSLSGFRAKKLVHEVTLFSDKVTDYPELPTDAILHDEFLSKLIQFVQVEKIKSTFLVTPCPDIADQPTTVPDCCGLKGIGAMQQAVESLTHISFDLHWSGQLVCDVQSKLAGTLSYMELYT